jgi:hypothetical protein
LDETISVQEIRPFWAKPTHQNDRQRQTEEFSGSTPSEQSPEWLLMLQIQQSPGIPGLFSLNRAYSFYKYATADYLAVGGVIAAPCSAELPENSEFTGNFLFFGTLPYSETFGNPSVTRSPRVCFIRCDETEQGITGKSREFATYCLQISFCAISEHIQRFPETSKSQCRRIFGTDKVSIYRFDDKQLTNTDTGEQTYPTGV